MVEILLLTSIAVILLTTLTALRLTATPQPATVNPFGTGGKSNSSNDAPTTSPDTASTPDIGWHSVELSRLRDVEDLLDSLEARRVRSELEFTGNDRFTVRWR